MFCRHHRALLRLVLALEVIANVGHCHPLHSWLGADILDQSGKLVSTITILVRSAKRRRKSGERDLPLEHKDGMRVSANIRMNRHGIAKVIVLTVKVIEVVPPEILDVFRINPAVRVGRFLDEHHGRQVIEIPVCRDLDKASIRTLFERLHPSFGVFAVVDFTPLVTGPKEVREAVVVGETMI